jgi:hypothetical protein
LRRHGETAVLDVMRGDVGGGLCELFMNSKWLLNY